MLGQEWSSVSDGKSEKGGETVTAIAEGGAVTAEGGETAQVTGTDPANIPAIDAAADTDRHNALLDGLEQAARERRLVRYKTLFQY